jgi:hypothetical protein
MSKTWRRWWSVLGDGDSVGWWRRRSGVPLTSAPIRSGCLGMWESYSTTIVGLRTPTTPLYLCGAAWRAPLPYMASTPDQGADWIGFPNSEDLFKRKEITFLIFSPLISTSHLNSIILLFTNQCTWHTASWQSVTYYQTQWPRYTFLFQIEFLSRPLYIQNHSLSLKPMSTKCSLNTLGGKPFVSGSVIIFLVLICSRLIVWS